VGGPPSEKRGQAQEKRGVYGVPAKLVTFSHTPRGHHSITAVLCAALARCNDMDSVFLGCSSTLHGAPLTGILGAADAVGRGPQRTHRVR
jgi:hypothetical protein